MGTAAISIPSACRISHPTVSNDIPIPYISRHHTTSNGQKRRVWDGNADDNTTPRPACRAAWGEAGRGRYANDLTAGRQAWDEMGEYTTRWTNETTERRRREERHGGRHDWRNDREHDQMQDYRRDLPAPRHGRTGSGDGETKDEQGKRRGERDNFAFYTITEERF